MNLPQLHTINFLDLLLGGILLLFTLRGLYRGAIAEVAGFMAFVLGIAVAGNSAVHGFLVDQLEKLLNERGWSNLLAYLLAFGGAFALVTLLGRFFQRLLNSEKPGLPGRLGGMLAGGAKGLIICTMLLIFLQYVAPTSQMKNSSSIVPYINSAWSGLSDLTDGFQHLPNFTAPKF